MFLTDIKGEKPMVRRSVTVAVSTGKERRLSRQRREKGRLCGHPLPPPGGRPRAPVPREGGLARSPRRPGLPGGAF